MAKTLVLAARPATKLVISLEHDDFNNLGSKWLHAVSSVGLEFSRLQAPPSILLLSTCHPLTQDKQDQDTPY